MPNEILNRKQFTFYRSFFDGISRIKDNDARCMAYDAVIAYALNGDEPDYGSLPEVAAIAFDLIRPHLDTARRKAEAGQKGGGSRNEANASKTQANSKQNEATRKQEKEQDKEQEKEQEQMLYVRKENIEKKSRTVFQPPTLAEVKFYCQERNNGINPSAFIDYYQQQKWKLSNGNPMSDWKAAVRNWEQRRKQHPPGYRESTLDRARRLEMEGAFDD